jgi:hypothetical protein
LSKIGVVPDFGFTFSIEKESAEPFWVELTTIDADVGTVKFTDPSLL